MSLCQEVRAQQWLVDWTHTSAMHALLPPLHQLAKGRPAMLHQQLLMNQVSPLFFSPSGILFKFIIFPVPASPPINLVADMIGSRFVILSWLPPAVPNGVITSYTVTYNLTGESSTSLLFQAGEQYTIPGLNPYSYYQFTVFASTILGDGPPTLPITLRTAVASEYM